MTRITGEMSHLIWPAEAGAGKVNLTSKNADAKWPPAGKLGLRSRALTYAWKEVFSRKQALMRLTVFFLLLVGTMAFTYLSSLGKGSVRYLTESTLNKPSEFLNRFTLHRTDASVRLDPEHIRFLKDEVPGRKAPTTFKQRIFLYEIYDVNGTRQQKNGAFSVTDGDDILKPIPPADIDKAEIGVVYRRGGPFPAGKADRAGVIVSEHFLKGVYLGYGDRADKMELQDEQIPKDLEFRMATGTTGVDEEEMSARYMPGANGRIKIPLVGVFRYPPLIDKNEVGGANALPQIYFPEEFLRRFDVIEGNPLWRWHYAFLTKRSDDDTPVTPVYPILEQVRIEIEGGKPTPGWAKKVLGDRTEELTRELKRPFGAVFVPKTDGDAIVLDFDQAREQSLQKWTKEKFLKEAWENDKTKPDGDRIEAALKPFLKGGKAKLTFKERPISDILPENELPPLETDVPVYSEAVVRVQSFRDVLPARRTVSSKFNAKDAKESNRLEIEPKGGQVVALERLESIGNVTRYGNVALQLTFFISLFFVIGITSYMHISSKTADIGILRTYGLSPGSIAWVYALELMMLILPAIAFGIGAAGVLAGRTNDMVAESVVLATASTGGDEGPGDDPVAAGPMPKVFYNLQATTLDNLLDGAKTVGVAVLIIGVVSLISVNIIKRQQVVDSLRGGTG